jgi:hypothetical protein
MWDRSEAGTKPGQPEATYLKTRQQCQVGVLTTALLALVSGKVLLVLAPESLKALSRSN